VRSIAIVVLWWLSLALIVFTVFMIIEELRYPGEYIREYGNQGEYLGEYSVYIDGAFVPVPPPKPEAGLACPQYLYQSR
jgi:hypothetical protein